VKVAMLCGPAPMVTSSPIITASLGVHDLLSKGNREFNNFRVNRFVASADSCNIRAVPLAL
jgi:hypothetical protein